MHLSSNRPDFYIHGAAPVRICDLGGWTDTWFAEYGNVLNIGVFPGVEVQVAVYHQSKNPEIFIIPENFGQRYLYLSGSGWQQHPLIEAAIQSQPLPQDLSLEISIYSSVPAGAAVGTSAAVSVALLGALNQLQEEQMMPHQLAEAAWRVETELLGQQSGIQDQLSAAYGGINWIQIKPYPQARVQPLNLPEELLWDLEERLSVIYLGKSHHSSKVHEMVIRDLEDAGPEAPSLIALRQTAQNGFSALANGDLVSFGQSMIANHEAQHQLHPGLISVQAERVIQIAQSNQALGWKANGAGGEGGSLTLLSGPDSTQKRKMLKEIRAADPQFQVLPIHIAKRGLHTWQNMP